MARAARYLFALSLIFASCTEERTGSTIVVEVQTDWVPGSEFRSVRVALLLAGREIRSEARDARPGPEDEAAFREGVRVAELDGLQAGTYRIRVSLITPAGAELASRTVELPVDDETVGLRVVLARACFHESCPGDGAPELTECVAGRCADPRCRPGSAERCPPPECSTDGDCAAAAPCATAACGPEGTCLAYPDSTQCPTGTFCHPELGCIDAVPEADAGPRDAGPPDAGVDAFVPWDPDSDPDLVAWFRFDDPDPRSAIIDASPSGLAGACDGPTTCPSTTTAARIGGALDFDGRDDRVRIPGGGVLRTMRSYTVAAWIRADELGTNRDQTMVAKAFGGDFRNTWQLALLDIDTDGELELHAIMDTTTGEGRVSTDVTFAEATWAHVAATWDGAVLRLWVAGVEAGANGGVTGALFDDSDVVVGADDDGAAVRSFFDGAVDDLRIYRRALEAPEVARLATSP